MKTTLIFVRFRGGAGMRKRFNPFPSTSSLDPFEQDPQPPHRFTPVTATSKTAADEAFVKDQIQKFDIGKRHLANMMGLDEDAMSPEVINNSIKYLFPSGLFSKRARPNMIDPRITLGAAGMHKVNKDNRPRNPFFYTTASQFNSICFSLSHKLKEADEKYVLEEKNADLYSLLSNTTPFDQAGRSWLSIDDTRNLVNKAGLTPHEYSHLLFLLSRLSVHPMGSEYSTVLENFISLTTTNAESTITRLKKPLPEDPKHQIIQQSGKRFTSLVTVTIKPRRGPEANISVNDARLSTYFTRIQEREQIMFPLAKTNVLNCFDIRIKLDWREKDKTQQANAARLAIAKSLVSFLKDDACENLRLSGLLTKDPRRSERKKLSQHGARRKKQFRKR